MNGAREALQAPRRIAGSAASLPLLLRRCSWPERMESLLVSAGLGASVLA